MLVVSLLVGAILVVLIALYKEYTKPVSHLVLPPKIPGAWPLLGNINALTNPQHFFKNAREKYGDLFRYTLLGREWYVLSGREYFQDYFHAREDLLSFDQMMHQLLLNRMSFGIEGHDGLMLGNYSTAVIKKTVGSRMEEAISRVAARCVKGLPEKGTLDLADFAQRMMGEIICETFLGSEVPKDLVSELQDYSMLFDKTFKLSGLSMKLARYLLLPKVDRLRNKLEAQFRPIAASALKNYGPDSTIFLKYIMENDPLISGNGEKWTEEKKITLFFITVFVAAVANSGQAFSNVLYAMADHPEKTAKLKAELDGLSLTDVGQNKALQSWIDEVSRMSKGFCSSPRIAMKDFELAGFHVPKDTWFFLDSLSFDIQANVIPDRETFKPERWLQPTKIEKNLNWGAGLHLCPGRNFAYAEIKYSVNQILKHLHFEKPQKPFKWVPSMSGPFVCFPTSYAVQYHKSEA